MFACGVLLFEMTHGYLPYVQFVDSVSHVVSTRQKLPLDQLIDGNSCGYLLRQVLESLLSTLDCCVAGSAIDVALRSHLFQKAWECEDFIPDFSLLATPVTHLSRELQ